MKDITRKYTNGEVTIVWKPSICIHSAKCFNGLAEVFHPQQLPWITPEHSTTDKIIAQVKMCPSGALSYYMNNHDSKGEAEVTAEAIVEPVPNGPLMVFGNVTVKNAHGDPTRRSNQTAFCRCGGSSNKPFCDGTHKKINFQG